VISICSLGQKGVNRDINMSNMAIVVKEFTDYDDLSDRLLGYVGDILFCKIDPVGFFLKLSDLFHVNEIIELMGTLMMANMSRTAGT